eukprot:gnl/TRDRNA2_/TRDRNA2_133195_c1_seq1.p1 gnl/TRDRNA2_/TRDRNA2_133195_c1~~gnl/TRDRNA2_/TRDRNA2_133195_c1_seq1.p1  ORF type:complete len:764 (+),score=131.37 gnl/TRDRNA2_/TRDRNA2_133195_c1_seq1:183-2294(+)
MAALEARVMGLLKSAGSAAGRVTELANAKMRYSVSQDRWSFYEAHQALSAAEAALSAAQAAAEVAVKELGLRTWRALHIVEAVLVHSRADLAEDLSLSSLLEDVLRPALLRADSVPPGAGGICWPSIRSMAVRCIALYASMSAQSAAEHWPFFLAVLSRCTPTALDRSADADSTAATEVVEHCVNFLSDALLSHFADLQGEPLLWEECTGISGSARAYEFFAAVAPLLVVPRVARDANARADTSPRLWRCLVQRMCAVLLFGGTWEAPAGADKYPQGYVSPGMHWALAWLLLETFVQPPPPAVPVEPCGATMEGLARQEAAEAAAERGRLLRFFSYMAQLSEQHAMVVAVAAESFLSLELWQLGTLVQLSVGRRWSAVSLPRLVRFLGRHLVGAAASPSVEREEAVRWWLECLWRPLALACMESARVSAAADAELPQSLLAAAAALSASAVAGTQPQTTDLALVPQSMLPAITSEVAWVLNRAIELWGWNIAGAGTNVLPVALIELRNRVAAAAASELAAGHMEHVVDWAQIYRHADRRRQQLQQAVAGSGIDVRRIISEISAGIRPWPAEQRENLEFRRPSSGRGGRGLLLNCAAPPPGALPRHNSNFPVTREVQKRRVVPLEDDDLCDSRDAQSRPWKCARTSLSGMARRRMQCGRQLLHTADCNGMNQGPRHLAPAAAFDWQKRQALLQDRIDDFHSEIW